MTSSFHIPLMKMSSQQQDLTTSTEADISLRKVKRSVLNITTSYAFGLQAPFFSGYCYEHFSTLCLAQSAHSFSVPISRPPLPKILSEPMIPVSLRRAKLTSEKGTTLGEEFPLYIAGNLTLSVQCHHRIRHKSIS